MKVFEQKVKAEAFKYLVNKVKTKGSLIILETV